MEATRTECACSGAGADEALVLSKCGHCGREIQVPEYDAGFSDNICRPCYLELYGEERVGDPCEPGDHSIETPEEHVAGGPDRVTDSPRIDDPLEFGRPAPAGERLEMLFDIVRVWPGRSERVVGTAANGNLADRFTRSLNVAFREAPYRFEAREVTR